MLNLPNFDHTCQVFCILFRFISLCVISYKKDVEGVRDGIRI